MWFLFLISNISIVSCVRPYLCPASRRRRPYYKWHNNYVLCTYVGFVQFRLVYKCFKRLHMWRPYYKWHNNYVLCTYVGFVQFRLVYKCFKRLHIRLLWIFWAIILFSNEEMLLGIRRLFSWLHGTRFVYLAYQHEMTQKGPRSTNKRPILFLSNFFFLNYDHK